MRGAAMMTLGDFVQKAVFLAIEDMLRKQMLRKR